MKKIKRSYFLLAGKMICLKTNTKFEKAFRKWYNSESNIVPCRIYDYIFKYHKSNRI